MSNLLIVLEGIDRCGKTSVTKLLQKKLKNSIKICFPDRTTPIGGLLDKFLKKELKLNPYETHLLYSANRYEKADFIRETLKTQHIVCDRYWLSGAVYSAAKGLDYKWCKTVDEALPQPDFTFFIDVKSEVTSTRGTFGSEAHDQIGFQTRVYDLYKEKAQEENVVVINGSQPSEEIANAIFEYLSKLNKF